MKRRTMKLVAGAAAAMTLAGCSTKMGATTSPAERQATINKGVDSTLATLYSSVVGSQELVGKARGVLVLPRVLEGAFGAGYGAKPGIPARRISRGAIEVRRSSTAEPGVSSKWRPLWEGLPRMPGGVARQTAYTWKSVLDDGDIDALRAVPTGGRSARLDGAQWPALGRMLLDKPTERGIVPEWWTLKRVGLLIELVFGVKFGHTQTWRSVGGQGYSVQEPERRVIERDEEAEQTRKRKTWPGPKRKPRAKDDRSSASITRA